MSDEDYLEMAREKLPYDNLTPTDRAILKAHFEEDVETREVLTESLDLRSDTVLQNARRLQNLDIVEFDNLYLKGGGQARQKRPNGKEILLKIIYEEETPLTLYQLAEETGLHASTVSAYCDDLADRDLIQKKKARVGEDGRLKIALSPVEELDFDEIIESLEEDELAAHK